MVQEKGTISIHTENIFPIIKKFLYSDNEIFLRELVSNAVDATQKIKRLAALGQYNKDLGNLQLSVSLDEDAKTITISDQGIGMTADEIKKYINPSSIIISDSYHSYDKVWKIVDTHTPMVVPSKEADKKLPWVHCVIANAKRLFLGIHHSIGKTYLQNYLNEFCYKLNRRNFTVDLFDRMIIAGASSTWY